MVVVSKLTEAESSVKSSSVETSAEIEWRGLFFELLSIIIAQLSLKKSSVFQLNKATLYSKCFFCVYF